MKVRTKALLVAGAVTTMLAGSSPLAGAAPGDTGATFLIQSGALAISVPTSTVDLGTVGTGAASFANRPLGNVTVTDARGALLATWVATVSSTDFTTGGASANETVLKSAISYSSGSPVTGSTGSGTFVPGTLATMTTPGTAAAWTAGVGNNTQVWNPQLSFTLLPTQVAGTYSGTISHSVL
ncbi:MAG TPA: hypothetical protein VHE80_00445 [Acidimicrobiales bacterium]|nr:hypothetical protein [Acidimicrobiales bacterium]